MKLRNNRLFVYQSRANLEFQLIILMKQFILPLITLLILGSANAQIEYESPHVKDGKTIRFTLPEGYFEVANGSFEGNEMFASQEGIDLDFDDIDKLPIGVLAVIHVLIEEQTLASFKTDLTKELIDQNDGIIVVSQPEIVNINGRDCMQAGFKGEIEQEPFGGIYFSVVEFGDYFIVISYYAAQQIINLLDYNEFEKIIASWKEIETTREDELPEPEDFYSERDKEYDFEETEETNYINDLFETEISSFDVLPDVGDNWDMPLDENSHLLAEFSYKKDNGTVKVFSGGSESNYSTDKELAAAIQLVMDLPTRLSLKKNSQFSNEDHFFQLYTISGGGTKSSVYITVVNNELVFFVVDGGSNPIPDFKPAVRDFMLTMWVDYFEEEEPVIMPELIEEK